MALFIARTESDTDALARRLAAQAEAGDVFALYGTLGAGKTTFARSFIRALADGAAEVPSPTFTLLQTYETPLFPIYHFDMYRLKNPAEAYEIGIEEAFQTGVSLIEWPEKITPLLPRRRHELFFEIHGTERHIRHSEKTP